MAGLAIGIGHVVKVDVAPVTDIVAVGTLARPVAVRWYVTRRTIVSVYVVKAGIAPVVDTVTIRTLTDIVFLLR